MKLSIPIYQLIYVWGLIGVVTIQCAPAFASEADGWIQFESTPDLVLYQKKAPDSSLVMFRGEGVVSAPITRVTSVLLDRDRAREWVDRLEEIRLIRHATPLEYVEYNHIKTPFVLKDRDFVLQVKLEVDPLSKSVVMTSHSVSDTQAPQTPYVRGEILHADFKLTAVEGGQKTRITAELAADPKGSVPMWIVNIFQRNWPRSAFRAIQKQVARPDVRKPPEFKDLITELEKFEGPSQ